MNKRLTADFLKQLPDVPGVYLFYSHKGDLIYVGKATSLKNRVKSYFVGRKTSRPIEQMMHEVHRIDIKETESVLEAIILEAKWIKERQPKYNVLGKDSKSWNYLTLSSDPYPLLKAIRQHDFVQLSSKEIKAKYLRVFGPFPGLNTRAAIKLLRKMFWVSSCTPDAPRPCLYYQMGDCLGVCTGEISATEYKRQVIQPLMTFLGGGKKRLIQTLERRMKKAAKEKDFESAARMRDQIKALRRIHDIALLNKSFVQSQAIHADGTLIERIEGYDISNLGATGKVGSMVVFDLVGPVKSEYKRFKIKGVDGQSDVDCLDEVLSRRLQHPEWGMPDLLLIDGGKPQVNRAKEVLKRFGMDIPLVGIGKGPDRKKNEFIFAKKVSSLVRWVAGHQDLLISVRDEAHCFALAYQRKLRKIKKTPKRRK